jgi:hypothetical protein
VLDSGVHKRIQGKWKLKGVWWDKCAERRGDRGMGRGMVGGAKGPTPDILLGRAIEPTMLKLPRLWFSVGDWLCQIGPYSRRFADRSY